MSPNDQSTKRIILTGASGTGKTTLAEPLAKLLDLPIIPELGREICKDWGYDNIGLIPDQEGFKRTVLEVQIEKENQHGSFISDRSTIDLWVLWQRWNICQAMTYDTEAYYEKTKKQAAQYTHIIYVPPMFKPQEDGFRWTEPDYQKQIDRLIRMTLHDWQLTEKTFTVTALEIEDRLSEITKWLGVQ